MTLRRLTVKVAQIPCHPLRSAHLRSCSSFHQLTMHSLRMWHARAAFATLSAAPSSIAARPLRIENELIRTLASTNRPTSFSSLLSEHSKCSSRSMSTSSQVTSTATPLSKPRLMQNVHDALQAAAPQYATLSSINSDSTQSDPSLICLYKSNASSHHHKLPLFLCFGMFPFAAFCNYHIFQQYDFAHQTVTELLTMEEYANARFWLSMDWTRRQTAIALSMLALSWPVAGVAVAYLNRHWVKEIWLSRPAFKHLSSVADNPVALAEASMPALSAAHVHTAADGLLPIPKQPANTHLFITTMGLSSASSRTMSYPLACLLPPLVWRNVDDRANMLLLRFVTNKDFGHVQIIQSLNALTPETQIESFDSQTHSNQSTWQRLMDRIKSILGSKPNNSANDLPALASNGPSFTAFNSSSLLSRQSRQPLWFMMWDMSNTVRTSETREMLRHIMSFNSYAVYQSSAEDDSQAQQQVSPEFKSTQTQ